MLWPPSIYYMVICAKLVVKNCCVKKEKILVAWNLKRILTWDHNILDASEDMDRQSIASTARILSGNSGISSSIMQLDTTNSLNLADSLMIVGTDTNERYFTI